MLDQILKKLVIFLNGFNTLLVLPSLVLLVISDVILRSLFSSPIAWAHELSGLLLLSMFFLAIPRCVENHELLSVDLLYQALSASKQRSLKRLSYLFLVLFSLLVVWQAVLGAIDSYTYEDQAYTIDIPYWPFYGLMAFIGLVTTLQSLSLLWASLDSSQTKEGHS